MVKLKVAPKNPASFQSLNSVEEGVDGWTNVLPTWEKALQKELKCFWESINNDVSE